MNIFVCRITSSHHHRLAAFVLALVCAGVINTQAATIYVTNLTQKVSTTGGCSLPEAIYSSEYHTNIAPNPASPGNFITTQAGVGDGNDTIILPTGAVFLMSNIINDVDNPTGPAATPIINSTITIEANGSLLEHVANGIYFRAFAVNSGESLTIKNAYIKGFAVKGGDGASGGGGGLGAGGAIYVVEGNLTVDSCTFEANGATGGNGSTGAFTAGGGGGGLGGNGGTQADTGLDGGGGGGGSRGNGGDGSGEYADLSAPGGGGGGTVTNGQAGAEGSGGGSSCGGNGGSCCGICILIGGEGGDDGYCAGGGGGGGASYRPEVCLTSGSGGSGSYGGGGGGSGTDSEGGGNGGFGGGGGAGDVTEGSLDGFGPSGGNGGFGGGGGAAQGGEFTGGPGNGGDFAGNASHFNGGGGAALGGAIFNDGGTIMVLNSTFFNNFVTRGEGGGAPADNGADAGGAIFSLDGSLTVLNSTIASNQSTGSDGGVSVYSDGATTVFTLRNTIIANNGNDECHFQGSVTYQGSGNFIVNNLGCLGNANTNMADPQLGPLQLNFPGSTPTMAITTNSPAFDAGDDTNCLSVDQRGVSRPQYAHCDVGAYEVAENLPPVALCSNMTVAAGPDCTASASIDGGSFDYDVGDTITLVQTPPGPYPLGMTTVMLTVTDNHGASNTCSSIVTVVDNTPPSITCPVNINQGTDPSQCGAIVTWPAPLASDNCGTVTTVCSPAPGSFFAEGTTPVTCTATDGSGNTNNCGFTVTVTQPSVCAITVSGSANGLTICQGGSVILTAANGMKSYLWSGPEQNGATVRTIVVSTAGTYYCTQAQYYGSTNCCSVTVVVDPPPNATITGNLVITNGLPTTLVGPSGLVSEYWTGPQNNGLASQSNTVITAGTYTLNIVDSNGCQNTGSVTVQNRTPAPCSITVSGDAGDLTICQGLTSILTGANGMSSYFWTGPEQSGATAKSIRVGTQGTYTVRQIDGAGLTNSCSVFLTVHSMPAINIFGIRTICQGSNTTLSGPSGMSQYLWLGPQNNGLTAQSNTVSFGGTYTLTVTDSNGCQNSLSVPVTTIVCP